MKRVFLYAAAFVALSFAAIGVTTAQPPPKEPTPAEVAERQQQVIEKQAAMIAELQLKLKGQDTPPPGGGPVFKKFKRGATKSPRHKLQAAAPHRITVEAPAQFATVPSHLSMWYNDTYGDCVTAQEAFSKACWSTQCGLPELFIPDAEVKRWASKYGFLDGANLTDVMDQMQKDGFTVNGVNYKDGPYKGVDYSNEAILQNAIFTGPVNIAIDANALPQGAGNQQGWYATGGRPGQFGNTDHCVALCGYGPAGYLFQQLGVAVPGGVQSTQVGYLLFTWNTIGFVDESWIMSTVAEAWVRNPTTPGQGPQPPATVAVPGVIGFTVPDARKAIEGAGLVFAADTTDPTLTVISETPKAGTQVAAGSTVTVGVNPPPPTPGDIIVTVPAGTQPGSYTIGGGLSPDDVASLQAAQDAIAGILANQGERLPYGWLRDKDVAGALGAACTKQGGEAAAAYPKVAGNQRAHALLKLLIHQRMTKDATGRALLAQYKAGALPNNWLINFGNWIIANFPAILSDIQAILKLFGL